MKHTIAAILAIIQLLLILFSWVVTTLMPSAPLRSLLSGEGVRWFFGSFVDNMSSPLLVYMLLCTIAYGAFVRSGLGKGVSLLLRGGRLSYSGRHALIWVALLFCVMVAVVIIIAFVPHAVLLGVSGTLFPGAFSAAIVPIAAFMITSLSLVYGVVDGSYTDLSKVFIALYSGIADAAPLFLIYVLGAQLFYSAIFVFA